MVKNIPEDINIEDLLLYLPNDTYQIALNGHHKRNAYYDIVNIEENGDKILFEVGRNSLYNSLPEFLFHTINRFDNLPELQKKELFQSELDKQEQEKENARKFFSIIDNSLLDLRVKVKERIIKYTSDNVVLQDIIADDITQEQRTNRFILRALHFIPYCKRIRGNRVLLSLMLRKILHEENLFLEIKPVRRTFTDDNPSYNCSLNSSIDSLYVGNVFEQTDNIYIVHYWSDEECDENFHKFLNEIEIFKGFLIDYFLSVEDYMEFQIVKDYPPLRLSDNMVCNYLNYNTNI